MVESEALRVAQRVRTHLRLIDARLPDVYFYASPTLCVIDAVFSIGVRYESVIATVNRYCQAFDLPRIRQDRAAWPMREHQEPMSSLVKRIDDIGAESFAASVLRNRQRTSARGGVLKAEAVRAFAFTLAANGIECFQDIPSFDENSQVHRDLRRIRGQGSGISIGYFWMLAGSDQLVKPDRMILGYLGQTLGRSIQVQEARMLIPEAVALLRNEYPDLSPRLLDYKIWEFQRTQPPARAAV
jgi:hypothetical protein